MSHTAPSPDAFSADSAETEVLDPAWLAAPARRSRGRIVLIAALAVLIVLLSGVEIQKRWGSASAPTADAAGPAAFSGGGLGAPPSGNSTGSTSTPAVIGTLTGVHGHTWTVKDLAGTSHTVMVTARTTLTRPLGEASGRVRTGTDVVIEGTTHGHAVTATAITVH